MFQSPHGEMFSAPYMKSINLSTQVEETLSFLDETCSAVMHYIYVCLFIIMIQLVYIIIFFTPTCILTADISTLNLK